MVFELTDACNQACRFCYNHFKGGAEPCPVAAPDFRMARRTLKRLLNEANIGSISFSGGEPMLMPRIHDHLLQARLGGSNVNLLTNGTLLKAEDVGIIRNLGVGVVQIPLLSHRAEVHDHITQLPGSWERAMASAKRIAEVDPAWLTPVFILSRLNVADIEPTLEMYAAMGCKRIMLNRFNIGGLGRKYAAELTLSHAELRDAFRRAEYSLGYRFCNHGYGDGCLEGGLVVRLPVDELEVEYFPEGSIRLTEVETGSCLLRQAYGSG